MMCMAHRTSIFNFKGLIIAKTRRKGECNFEFELNIRPNRSHQP
jgi:hypothetical protein